MNRSLPGTSVFVFSFWVLLCGVALLVVPGLLLPLMGVNAAGAPVARIFGMVLTFLGYYYLRLGRAGCYRDFYRWSTQTRLAAVVVTAILVFLRLVPVPVLAFLAVDGLGAVATLWALRRTRAGATGQVPQARD